jgi:hypothetical protein
MKHFPKSNLISIDGFITNIKAGDGGLLYVEDEQQKVTTGNDVDELIDKLKAAYTTVNFARYNMRNFLVMLDEKMATHQERLVQKVGLTEDCSNRLASCIAEDLRQKPELLDQLVESSPLPINERLNMFEAYQMEYLPRLRGRRPPLPNATSMTMEQFAFVIFDELLPSLYMCVVFAADNLFDCIKKGAPSGSVAKKCAKFIRDDPLRALRNALAHGNWRFAGYGALEYWARKDDGSNHVHVTRFEIDHETLRFYLDLCTYYAWVLLLTCAVNKGYLDE